MAPVLPPAVVFDCDGTIADTESLANRAWAATLATVGYAPSAADFEASLGHTYQQVWAYYSARVNLGDPDEFRKRLRETYATLLRTELEVHADAVKTMRDLASAQVPIAVASSSSHWHVERILDMAEVRSAVTAIVGADDVPRHKPDPLPYLRAAELLGFDPVVCIAVEDTAVGVAAAKGAGMFTVAVVRGHQTPADLAAADRIVDRLDLAALVS